MSHSHKLSLLLDNVKRSSLRSSQRVQHYVLRKKDSFLSLPIISSISTRAQYLVSPENIENMKLRCDETYHWVAGTEVTEVQERARELERKLNMKRKNMLEARELMDNVTERLREIVVELENTRRGDPKHLHLRQLEYDTIQEEMKLSKQVQKTEFEERETFTWLMNAVRESHETERNYNQRIKMLSLIGAALGPFIGYMFSARLNAMRFRKMEEIINKKLELLSFTTLNAIREIHGLEPEVMSDAEKQNFISRLLGIFHVIQSSLVEGLNIAVTSSAQLLESIQEEPETVESAEATAEVDDTKPQTKETSPKPETKDASSQVTTTMPVERIIVEKMIPQEVDYANLPEFKSLVASLKTIQDKQDTLKELLITAQELQDAGKIEVSVNSSDDEIISMLQADQQMVRKILLSVSDLLQDSRTSIGATLDSIVSNIDSLSMKITNNSELYVGNLEHSKIINDIVKSLDLVKSNIDTIETYYINDVNRQFTELTNIHGDLSKQIDGVKQDLEVQARSLDKVNDSLVDGFSLQEGNVSKISDHLSVITELVTDIRSDKSVESVIEKVDQVTDALAEIKTLLVSSAEAGGEKLDIFEKLVSDNLEKSLQNFETNILNQYQNQHDAMLEKMAEMATTLSTTPEPTDPITLPALQDLENVEKAISENLDKTLQEFQENILSEYQSRHDALKEKIDEISTPPATIICSASETDLEESTVTGTTLQDSQLQPAPKLVEAESCKVSAVEHPDVQVESAPTNYNPPVHLSGFPEEILNDITPAVEAVDLETSELVANSEEMVSLSDCNNDTLLESGVLLTERVEKNEIPIANEPSDSYADEATGDDCATKELPLSLDHPPPEEDEASLSALEVDPSVESSHMVTDVPVLEKCESVDDLSSGPTDDSEPAAACSGDTEPAAVCSDDSEVVSAGSDDDASTEHVGYPGAVPDKKSSVYLYSACVAVYTVIVYFLR